MKRSYPCFNFASILSALIAIIGSVTPLRAQTPESDELFDKGMTLFEQGKYKDAIENFRQVWELDSINVPDYMPNYESGKDWMAYAYLKLGNKAMAKEMNPIAYDMMPVDRRKLGIINDYFQQYHDDLMNQMPVLAELHISSAVDEAEKQFGKESIIYLQSLVGLTTFYYERQNEKKLNECVNRLERVIDDMPVKNKYLSAYRHLMKGWTYFYRGKYSEALAEARKSREEFKGFETKTFYELGKLSNLFGAIVYYGDPSAFDSPEAALAELKEVIDGNINAYFSLPPSKWIDGSDLMAYSLDALVYYPNVNCDEYDEKIAKYIENLRGANREKYPFIDNSISYALHCRALINNIKANITGKGFEKVWELAEEAISLAEESTLIEKKNCLELMMVGANALISLQRYQEAEKIMDEVLALAADKSNGQEYYLIDAVNGKSLIEQRTGRMDHAIETMRKHLPEIRGLKNKYPSEVANFLLNYADALSLDGRNLKEYGSVLKEVVTCFEKLDMPEMQGGYMQALLKLALMSGVSAEESESLLKRAGELIEKLKTNPLITSENIISQEATLLNVRALAARASGNYNLALEYNDASIDLMKRIDVADRGDLLDTRMRILKDMNKFEEAHKVGENLLSLTRRIYGPEDVNTIHIMSDMIDIYSGNLMWDKAEEMVSEIEKVLETAWMSLSPEFLTQTLILMGTYYTGLRNYDKALQILEKAKSFMARKNVDPSWEIPLITAYLTAKSKTEKSDEVFDECKALAKGIDKKGYNAYQKFHLRTSLALVAKELGELGYASEWFDKAYGEYSPQEGDDIMYYTNTLVSYNDLLTQLGRQQEAMAIGLKYFELLKKFNTDLGILSRLKEFIANTIDSASSGDADAAFANMVDMHKELVRDYGETSDMAQNLLKSIIEAYPNMGYSEQEAFQAGLPTVQKLREESKIGLPSFLILMLECSQFADDAEDSERLIEDVNKIPENQLTPIEKVRILSIKGNLALKKADTENSLQFHREAFEKARGYVLDNFLSMSAEERESFWNNSHQFFRTQIPQAAGVAIGMGGVGYEPLVYETALFTNSLLLSSDATIDDAVASSKDKKVKKAYQEYSVYKQQLADAEKNYAQKVNTASTGEYEKRIDDLRTAMRKSERNLLGLLSDKLGRYNSHLAISPEDVRKSLGDKDVAIEFLEFPAAGNASLNQYVAALIRGNEEVKLIPLFATAPDDPKWLECYDSDELFNVLWKPLEPHLQGVKDIWFAPQGKLSVTAIESLPGLETLNLGNPFVMHRLTSTRQLALNKMNDEKRNNKNAEYVAYGGINYGASDMQMSEADKERRKSQKRGTRSVVNLRDVFGEKGREVAQGIEELPGTEKEAEYLVNLIKTEHKGKPTLLTGAKATEGSFKDYSGRTPLLMHIGTHGFYSDDINTSNLISPEEMAMQHSGLLLAGAEKGLYEPESLPFDAEDGILTASEISQLDLSGSELIVMSACETGLGKVSADGVFGLQRGFKKAGANALMMSLWKVDDEATSRLMEAFYDGWLREGLSKSEALIKAKEAVKSDKRWESPKYWAAFILLDALD